MNRPVQVPASNSNARKAAAEKFALRPEDQFSIHVPETTALTIKHPDGRDLLVIHRDGTVTGDIEDAGEAAAIFVREVKRLFGGATDTAAPEGECGSCGENEPADCPKSKRPCGHHCNHIWVHDACDWCGREFGADDEPGPAAPVAVEGVETEGTAASGLAVAAYLLRQVVDYWDGRPLTHHGDHIYADLLDVLRAITPVEPETSEPEGGDRA